MVYIRGVVGCSDSTCHGAAHTKFLLPAAFQSNNNAYFPVC